MATGGSGDVLTGVMLALLAQGYPTEEAAKIGTYIHGLAGDVAHKEARHDRNDRQAILSPVCRSAWRLVSE